MALYVHIPFCPGRCTFCHYYRISDPDQQRVERYLELLAQELQLWENLAQQQRSSLRTISLTSLYIGGGTPTFLSIKQLKKLFQIIRNHFNIDNLEVCVESTPDTITKEKLKCLEACGTNRISIGIQTFSDSTLQQMHRCHDAKTAKEAIMLSKKFMAVNADMLYGFPGHSFTDWYSDLQQIHALGPDFITTFRTRIKGQTPLAECIPPAHRYTHQQLLFMQFLADKILTDYTPLYNNQYAKEKTDKFIFQETKWQEEPFLGLGPSAYSYLDNLVYNNKISLADYEKDLKNNRLPIGSGMLLSLQEQYHRYMVLGIKSANGINLPRTAQCFGIDPSEKHAPIIKILSSSGLIEFQNDLMKLSSKGRLFANEIAALFFSQETATRMQRAEEMDIESLSIRKNWEE